MNFTDGRMKLTDNFHKNGPVSLEMYLLELSLEDFKPGKNCSINVTGRHFTAVCKFRGAAQDAS